MAHKILLVDDDPSVLKLVSISLKKAGYEVETASDGIEGLKKMESFRPDLIISDVVMPEMDGITFCKKIREESSNPMIPFIFMTSLSDEKHEIRGYRAGADEYLVKPVERSLLLEKVEKLLKRLEGIHPFNDKAQSDSAFQGNLSDLTLAEVIQLLHLNRRKGVLLIHDPRNEQPGKIVMENGQMIYAEMGNLAGEEAVQALVRVKEGTFEFKTEEYTNERNIHGSTMNILMEALRLMDEESAGE